LNPVVVELSPSSTATSANVTQMVYPVQQGQKKAILQAILELSNMTSALIFTRTKHGANKLLITLREWGKKAAVIHSNRSQAQRQQALQGFKNKDYQILVATDIAARGIDVKDISHVINYDVPRHPEDYVHRIGRTGRAQSVGEAFTLVSPDEEVWLKKIESFIRKSLPRTVIPDFPYQSKPRVMPNASTPRHQHHSHPKPLSHPHQSTHHAPKPHHEHRPQRSHFQPSSHQKPEQRHSRQFKHHAPKHRHEPRHQQHPSRQENPFQNHYRSADRPQGSFSHHQKPHPQQGSSHHQQKPWNSHSPHPQERNHKHPKNRFRWRKRHR
jgi:superfamily II DNA/RNA helicase